MKELIEKHLGLRKNSPTSFPGSLSYGDDDDDDEETLLRCLKKPPSLG